ncbi:MAG: CPBP family intramembrane metalloprotease [Planctomycetota bacterium]|nr:MAG: CPBP family intramembrane metalloprotease [Planctomycetota bacterium]
MNELTGTAPSALLRIMQSAPVRLVLLGGILFLVMGVSSGYVASAAKTPLLSILTAVGMAIVGLAIYAAFVHFVERRPVSELALAPLGRDLGIGLLVGSVLYTACVLILMLLGIYRIEGLNPASFMLPAVAMALSSGFLEELVFRGALFRIVEEMFGSWVSIIVSSFVFGFLHLLNPKATLLGALLISVEAGLLLAAAFMLTRRLWLGIGFHISWNYTQSGIFSGVVSGGDSDPGLVKPMIEGPDLLTGGSFGLESSLIACLLCTTAGVIVLIKAIKRGNVVLPFWQRAAKSDQRVS